MLRPVAFNQQFITGMLRPVAFNQQFIAGMLRPDNKPDFSAPRMDCIIPPPSPDMEAEPRKIWPLGTLGGQKRPRRLPSSPNFIK